MNTRRSLRPTHIFALGAMMVAFSLLLLILKAWLMSKYIPPTTVDATGVATTTGPFSYDNNLLDGFAYVSAMSGLVFMISSALWKHMINRKRFSALYRDLP